MFVLLMVQLTVWEQIIANQPILSPMRDLWGDCNDYNSYETAMSLNDRVFADDGIKIYFRVCVKNDMTMKWQCSKILLLSLVVGIVLRLVHLLLYMFQLRN